MSYLHNSVTVTRQEMTRILEEKKLPLLKIKQAQALCKLEQTTHELEFLQNEIDRLIEEIKVRKEEERAQ